MTRSPNRRAATAFLLGCVLVLVAGGSIAGWARAQQDPTLRVLASINGARIANGLPPYAPNERLQVAAQGHSQDMAAHDLIGQLGSDGSTAEARIAAAGYPAYSSGIVSAELVHRGSEASPDWWMSSPEDSELVLSTRYREVGIGLSMGENGQAYWTVDLGAQPNVLPIFIDHGAPQTDAPTVTLTLSNEGAVILGDGPQVMGLAQEVRVSDSPAFSGSDWQPWFAETEWELSAGEGIKTVYVEFRDQQGRGATSQASINRVEPGTALSSPLIPGPAQPTAQPAASPPYASIPTPSPFVSPGGGPTPLSAPTATPAARAMPLSEWLVIRPQAVLPLVCGLQFIGSLLGFIIVARRRRPPSEHS